MPDDVPNFPHYENPKAEIPRGIPLLPDQKQQSPLIKLSMKMLLKPKTQLHKPFNTRTKVFSKPRKKAKFW
jgi:hypothetical protein